MITINMQGDRELVAKLNAMPGNLRAALVRKTYELVLRLEGKVKQKLSGQVLNVVTGALRRSIHSKVTSGPEFVRGQVFSSGDVKYAAIHEFGGKTRAHQIVATKARALSFMMGGKQVFAQSVNHPGSTIPARPYMRPSLAEMRDDIVRGYRQAAMEALQK